MDGIGDVFNMVELVDLSREIVHEDMYVNCMFGYVSDIGKVWNLVELVDFRNHVASQWSMDDMGDIFDMFLTLVKYYI